MRKRITMADVAREAGVSLMTVSRVINNKDEVSPATRQRVRDVIERLDYRPSDIARGLVTRRTGTIGLVVPDNANPFFSEVARGAEHTAYTENYNVFLCNTEEDPQREIAVLQSLEEKRVDGVVLCSSRLSDDELRAALVAQSAIVLVNRRLKGEGRVSAVLVDDESGAQMAIRHLLNTGRRTIGFLAGPPRSYNGQKRARGYAIALTEAEIPLDPTLNVACEPYLEGGRQAAEKLLTVRPDVDALFCYNDLVAVGALQACAALGRRVPDDVAVIGNDDIMLAELVTPPLTTLRVDKRKIGALAVQILIEEINNHNGHYRDVILPPTLIVRASAP